MGPERLVAFRCDASEAMGVGHLMRCLTLADAIAAHGATALFLCGPVSRPWLPIIAQRGHAAHPLDIRTCAEPAPGQGALPHAGWLPWGWREDARATSAALPSRAAWLICDHYALDTSWHAAVRAEVDRVLAIDDLADRAHDCDVLLDHNLQPPSRDCYAGLVPPEAIRLLGPRYALLRPAFAAACGRFVIREDVRRVLVFMGGSDPDAATLAALEALDRHDLRDLHIDVVAGGGNPHLERIRRRVEQRGEAELWVDTPNMSDLVAAADIGVGAGGGAALERCCIGLPSVCISIAPNQDAGLALLAENGAIVQALSLDPDVIADAVADLRGDFAARQAMSKAARTVTDGHGADRVARILFSQGVEKAGANP